MAGGQSGMVQLPLNRALRSWRNLSAEDIGQRVNMNAGLSSSACNLTVHRMNVYREDKDILANHINCLLVMDVMI